MLRRALRHGVHFFLVLEITKPTSSVWCVYVCVYSILPIIFLFFSERFDKMIVGLEKEQTDSRDKLARLQAEYQQLINKTGTIR